MRNEHDGGRKTGLRVVLDTNVYIAAFHFPEGVCARLVEYAADQYYELIISPVIIREFAGASRRDFQVNEEKHLSFIKFLGKTGTIVVPRIIPDIIKEDSADNRHRYARSARATATRELTRPPEKLLATIATRPYARAKREKGLGALAK